MLDGIRDGRPGDQRGFIHKKILGGVSTLAGVAAAVGVPGAGAVQRITAVAARRTVPRTETARVTRFSEAERQLGQQVKFGAPSTRQNGEFLGGDPECRIPGMRVDPGTGECAFFFGERKGPNGGFPLGEVVMGRYGAGFVPGSMVIDRAVCGKKMQLGDDGVCYNKSQISNKQRMWPAGRRPLLTGGDMRAISTASRAGTRMDKATARLRKLGMMKKASAGGATPAQIEKIRHAVLLEAHAAGSKH